MKKLIIKKLTVDSNDILEVEKKLQMLPANDINVINWPDVYPSQSEVSFRIAHNNETILLQYQVHENEIMAVITEDNEDVWTDSCVEFFISFDNRHYYNLEVSCIGIGLLGYRGDGTKAEHASSEVMKSICRLPSLGMNNREKEQGDFHWLLTLVIPRKAFWKDDIQSFSSIKAHGNFYKCGDNLIVPHFLSWTEIDTPKPSFHQPQFFGELQF